MLVGRLEIHVGRIAQLGMQRANRLMRDAAVDPDVDPVGAFGCIRRQTNFFCESGIIQFEPNI